MKLSLSVVCFFVLLTLSTGQSYNWKHAILPAGLSFVSGASSGLHETILHHYPQFKSKFPEANDQYWNPDISWKNKYANGNNADGPKFPGSTTVFVFTTDAYHFTNSIHRWTLFSAGLTIGIGEKRPWWHYAIDTAVSFVSYSIGFHAVYSVYFK